MVKYSHLDLIVEPTMQILLDLFIRNGQMKTRLGFENLYESRLLYKWILTKWIHFFFNMDFASRFACIDYHQCNIFIHTLIYDYSKIQCGIDDPDNEESMEDLQWNWNCTANDKDIIFVDLSL